MPTLVIEDVPKPLYDRIQHLALVRNRTPNADVLEVLETAYGTTVPKFSDPPRPQEPFMTEEICAPFTLPRPEGRPVRAVRVPAPLPTAHDFPNEE